MKKAFHAEMQKQKDRSRAASAVDTGDWVVVNDLKQTASLWVMITWKQSSTCFGIEK